MGTARSRNEPTSRPVNAPKPPARKRMPNVSPSPLSSRMNFVVVTPLTNPPARAPDLSKVTFTLG
jgi:hypothetical protein